VKLLGLVVLLTALSVSAASAGRRQEAGWIVFASNRTETLIPTEVRAFDLTRGRSTRVSILPRNLPEDMVWSPNGRALAYVDGVSDLYVLQPRGSLRRIARRLGAADERFSWSHDGRQIAYLGRDRGRLSVYVVRANGRGLRLVARRIADAPRVVSGGALAWSPEDRKLAIVASRRGRHHLVILDLRTGRIRPLSSGRGVPTSPGWSPDGGRIAFQAQVPGERAVVRTVGRRGGTLRNVHRAGGIPLWSPNGRRLAVDEKHSLWIYEDGVARLVATHPPISDPPVWSPDSRRLVLRSGEQLVIAEAARRKTRRLVRDVRRFYLESSPAWIGPNRIVYVGHRRDPGDLDLHLVREDGSGARALTVNGVGEFDPAWSPDGRFVAYSRARGKASDVWVIGSDGGGARRVVADAGSPTWSPDGTRIAVERAGDIWVAALDGSPPAQLTSGPETDADPDWSPRADEIAFSRTQPVLAMPRDIHAVRVADGRIRKITDESAADEGCFGRRASEPAWSPDGSHIAYELEEGGSSTCSPSRGHQVKIYAVGADGTGRRFVTDGGYWDALSDDGALTPSWSSDGARIFFVSSVSDTAPEYAKWSRIGVVSADGGRHTLITPKSYTAYTPDARG
jgi:Tol biopolymer transport system component